MNQQELEQLQELSRYWRKRDYGTGDANYDQGYDIARESCADALDELIEDWQQKQKQESMYVVDLKTKPMSRLDLEDLLDPV